MYRMIVTYGGVTSVNKRLRRLRDRDSLRTRFEHSGDTADLDKAISLVGYAVDITPDDHPDAPRHMMSLGNSLMLRFLWFGKLDDLVSAVPLHSKSADLTPDSHPNKANRLTSAGCSLQRLFERLGNLEDSTKAIQFHDYLSVLSQLYLCVLSNSILKCKLEPPMYLLTENMGLVLKNSAAFCFSSLMGKTYLTVKL